MWLSLAITGFVTAAIVNILDKFILSQKKVAPSVFAFYSTIFLLPLLLLAPLGIIKIPSSAAIGVALISGLCYTLALYTMYRAQRTSEVSHLGPFLGALIPLGVIVLGRYFLGEVLQTHELMGAALLILGSFIISFEKSTAHNGLHLGLLWALLAAACFAVYQVGSKYVYTDVGFVSGLMWVAGATGLGGALLIVAVPVRASLRASVRAPSEQKARARSAELIAANKILSIVMIILVQYASAQGSVSLVNALSGVQYAALVILVALMSKFFPKVFHEEYARGEFWQESIAVACIALGLGIILW